MNYLSITVPLSAMTPDAIVRAAEEINNIAWNVGVKPGDYRKVPAAGVSQVWPSASGEVEITYDIETLSGRAVVVVETADHVELRAQDTSFWLGGEGASHV